MTDRRDRRHRRDTSPPHRDEHRPRRGKIQDDPSCGFPGPDTMCVYEVGRGYVDQSPFSAARGGSRHARVEIDFRTASPDQLVQYMVNLKAANYFSRSALSPEDARALGDRLGYLAGMGGQLDKPVHGSYEHPLEGTKKTYAPNPRAGLAELMRQTFPNDSAAVLAGFDAGARRGTGVRTEMAAALGELKQGLSHEQLAEVGHRLGKAVRALPAGANQTLPLAEIAKGLAGIQGGEQMLAYLRASGTHTPQGMINLTAATGYVSDPAAQQILKEAFKAGAAGRGPLSEQRIAQIEAKPAKVDTPAGRAIARMEQISNQIALSLVPAGMVPGAGPIKPEDAIRLAHEFGRQASTPILAAKGASLAGIGNQTIPDAMLPQFIRKGVESSEIMKLLLPTEPAAREVAIGKFVDDAIRKVKATNQRITGALVFETLVLSNVQPQEHQDAMRAALQAGLKGQPLPKARPARTSELEVEGAPRLADLPDAARAQVAAVVAKLDVTLTDAAPRPTHELPEHLRAAAAIRDAGQPALV